MSDALNTTDWSDLNTTAHLDDLPLRKKIPWILKGLTAPTCTGHAKWALFQARRSYAVVSAFVIPLLVAALLSYMLSIVPKPDETSYTVDLQPKEKKVDDKPLEPIPQLQKPLDTKSDTRNENKLVQDMVDKAMHNEKNYDKLMPEPTPDQAPTFSDVAVLNSPSPFKVKALMANGGPRMNLEQGLRDHDGSPQGEESVLLALRWLKKTQSEDGTWGVTKPALTSLVLLTYLAHGETPESEEFGYTVEKAITWLLDNQNPDGTFKGSDQHAYSLPIAAYALAEAFSMTKIPDVRYAAEKAVRIVVAGQHADGGWDYNCKPGTRNDTSYSGWCIQALKAAKFAELDIENLDHAMKQASKGLICNYSGNSEYGGFGYTGGAQSHGLTSVGVLCMQILGESKEIQVESGLRTLGMDKFKFDLLNPKCGQNALYYWYYTTQAMFHAGGEQWNSWNKSFSRDLVSTQKVIAEDQSDYVDHKGQRRAIGFWDQYDGNGKAEGPTFPTVLCALQLEVYYRYLPSYQTPTEKLVQPDTAPLMPDINIEIIL